MRESLKEARSSFVGHKDRTSIYERSTISNEIGDFDFPVTMQQESFYDWSSCSPGQTIGNIVRNIDENIFSVTVQNEPVVWIFSRTPINGDRNVNYTRGSPPLHLKEIQFFFAAIHRHAKEFQHDQQTCYQSPHLFDGNRCSLSVTPARCHGRSTRRS